MRPRAILLLMTGALTLGACDFIKTYDLQNPATGQQATCVVWANSVFDAGATTDPKPFRNCIAACEARGFEPVSSTVEDANDEKATDTYVPRECR